VSASYSKICGRCAGAMIFKARISLPPQTIHECGSCGYQKWEAEETPYHPHAIKPDQPHVLQQQQDQPKSEAQHKADENADARRLQSGLRGGDGDK